MSCGRKLQRCNLADGLSIGIAKMDVTTSKKALTAFLPNHFRLRLLSLQLATSLNGRRKEPFDSISVSPILPTKAPRTHLCVDSSTGVAGSSSLKGIR